MKALVIGNASYLDAPLANPKNDAEDFTKAMNSFGFSVNLFANCCRVDLQNAIDSFQVDLESHDVGLFYFAGHGMQIEGENYITALDTNFQSKASAKHTSFSIDMIIDLMEESATKTNILILDACRNNPYERRWYRTVESKGLAPVYAPKGTIVAFATSPGETASDGSGRNGMYTYALLRHIYTPDISIEEMFKRVRNTLAIVSGDSQTSWEHTSLTGDFSFNISFGNQIDRYSKEAIADELFPIDMSVTGHKIIGDLKSHSWYSQNPGIFKLRSVKLEEADINTLFVIGRNVYQAACGDSNGALDFIERFKEITERTPSSFRTALLDGILFEIFFDKTGSIRKKFKMGHSANTHVLHLYGHKFKRS